MFFMNNLGTRRNTVLKAKNLKKKINRTVVKGNKIT